MGISVKDAAGVAREAPAEEEFEIRGVHETVLKNNMEQLQWTALSVLLLALSTALLATAQDLPANVVLESASGELAEMQETLPEALSVTADFWEQVCRPSHLFFAKANSPSCVG